MKPRWLAGESAAFSLIELVVVVVIIGIMTGVIVGEMKGTFEDALLRSSARKIISAASLAHSQSATVHQPHRLNLDTTTGIYQIEQWRSDSPDGGGFEPIPQVPGAEGTIDPRISLEVRMRQEEVPQDMEEPLFPPPQNRASRSSQNTVMFSPDGTAEPVEILLRDRTGVGLTLRINPVTSRVRIIELKSESE